MALDNNAARAVWETATEPEIFDNLMISTLANNRFESDLQTAGKAYKILDRTNYATSETAITSSNIYNPSTYNHASLVEVRGDSETISWNREYKGALVLTEQQMADATINTVVESAQRQARQNAEKMEDRWVDVLQSVDLSAVRQSFRQDTTGTQSNVITVGSSSNYMDDNAVFQGANADQDTWLDEIRKGLLLFARRKIHGVTGTNERRMNLMMGPTLWYNMITAIEAKDADVLKTDDLNGMFRGTLYGYYDIYVHARLDADETVGGKRQKQAYAFSSEGLTFATRFGRAKTIDPMENQDSFNWELHQKIDALINTDDERFIYRFNVRNEA